MTKRGFPQMSSLYASEGKIAMIMFRFNHNPLEHH